MSTGTRLDREVETAAQLYLWGFPLVTMRRTSAAHGRDPTAGLFARNRLSTAKDRTVVAPNNDTLYASGWFDLRQGDLSITVAAMDRPDRYWSVMLLDAYTNVSYICRRLHGTDGASVRVVHDSVTVPDADATPAVMPMATPTVWVLGRVLVDGPQDMAAAIAAQAGLRVVQDGADALATIPPAPTPVNPRPAPSFYAELRAALAIDPPAVWHPAMPEGGQALLDAPPADDVLQAGIDVAEARMQAKGPGSGASGNGWGTRRRGADFGDDIAYRAGFAKVSLAGHLPAENRAYVRPFDGRHAAALRFPPAHEPPVDGFWSLTVYGPDTFFVDNVIDRYSIGDRTPGLRRDADGGLTIELGPEPPQDPSNWLPTPAGPCFLALRAYEGRPAIVDATWFPPDLRTIEPS